MVALVDLVVWPESPRKTACAVSKSLSAFILWTGTRSVTHWLFGEQWSQQACTPTPSSGTRAYRKSDKVGGQLWFRGVDVETLTFK